jgi:hypothetical protein
MSALDAEKMLTTFRLKYVCSQLFLYNCISADGLSFNLHKLFAEKSS